MRSPRLRKATQLKTGRARSSSKARPSPLHAAGPQGRGREAGRREAAEGAAAGQAAGGEAASDMGVYQPGAPGMRWGWPPANAGRSVGRLEEPGAALDKPSPEVHVWEASACRWC